MPSTSSSLRSWRDRLADARAAAELCREALTYRNPERDADNWAYTQINLAYAPQTQAQMGTGDFGEARSAYQAVIDCSDAIADRAPGLLTRRAARGHPPLRAENNLELIAEYCDFHSGWRKSDARPEFQQLMADAAAGAFDVVLVFHTSRFARNQVEARRYKQLLRERLGIRVISVTQPMGDDPSDPSTFLAESIHDMFDEYYSISLPSRHAAA